MTGTPNTTREAWLEAAAAKLAAFISDNTELTVPPVRISVGFPVGSRGGTKSTAIGSCHPGALAADGIAQLFISPALADSSRVMDVLLHELLHASLPTGTGHRAPFSRAAKACGLKAPFTATTATAELMEVLAAYIVELGDFPHAALSRGGTAKSKTYLLKASCESLGCPGFDYGGYVIRITRKWAAFGPTCALCGDTLYIEF